MMMPRSMASKKSFTTLECFTMLDPISCVTFYREGAASLGFHARDKVGDFSTNTSLLDTYCQDVTCPSDAPVDTILPNPKRDSRSNSSIRFSSNGVPGIDSP